MSLVMMMMMMMKKTSTIAALAGLAALLLTPACTGRAVTDGTEPVELRTYTIPHGYENDVRTMLRYALTLKGTDEAPIGRVDIGPAGKLVVVAPPRIQEGVRGLVAELDRLDAPPSRPAPVKLTYWILVARPMGATPPPMPSDVPVRTQDNYAVVGADALAEVRPALEQIVAAQGPTAFSLIERLQLISFGDGRADASGRVAQVEQRATTIDDRVVADLSIRVRQNHISTQVELQPGQFLVLGQSGFSGDIRTPLAIKAAPEEMTLYYVIASDPSR